MKELVGKLMAIEKETSKERGEYDLFALFLREDSPNKWETLVSASWINNKEEVLKYLAQKIQQIFTQDELFQISRIEIIEKNNPALPALQQAISVEHGAAEIKDSNFFGLQIKHAFLITSKEVKLLKGLDFAQHWYCCQWGWTLKLPLFASLYFGSV